MAEEALTKKERDVEFTTIDKNEEIIERGRRASYRENNKAEIKLRTSNAILMLAIFELLKKNNYRASKLTTNAVKEVFKKMNKDAVPIAEDLEAGVKTVTKKTGRVHANEFGYSYTDKEIRIAIDRAKTGFRLSRRLHRGNAFAFRQLMKVMNKGMRKGESAVNLAMKLANISDIVAKNISIPKHIKEIEKALKAAARVNDPIEKALQLKEIRRVLKKHTKYIESLTRAGEDGFQQLGIRRATRKFAKQAEALIADVEGLNENNINIMVDRWRKQKVLYYQTRVTRTETNRMYGEYNREHWIDLQKDGIIVAIDSVLSDSHPKFDICDILQGRYFDIENAPIAPHHTNCICRNVAVTSDDIREENGLPPNKPFKRGEKGNGRVAA